ncbi:uncharacterized protein [Halyomorpha halys]|uniref:uncharacterized protein n=1 Tax=Halyomorpha halys TaxID=286706 RepID=UPI0034D1BAB2
MKTLSVILLALIVIVSLCKGAPADEGYGLAVEGVLPAPDDHQALPSDERQKREIDEESQVLPAPDDHQALPSDERQKREIDEESQEQPDLMHKQLSGLYGNDDNKNHVELATPISCGALASLCG